MKHPVSPEQRPQVIDLRRSHSLAEVAASPRIDKAAFTQQGTAP